MWRIATVRFPALGGLILSALAWFLAVSPYAFQPGFAILALYSGVPLFFGGYFLAKQFLSHQRPWVWGLSSLVAYMALGTPAVLFVENAVGFTGGFALIPIWPLGVFFMSYSDRPFDSAPLVGLAIGLATLTVAALVLVGILARNRHG
jgi:hypothetical protein